MRLPFRTDSSITLGGEFAHGGTSTIQRGILHRSSELAGNAREEVVALKVLFIADPICRQIFQREVEKWRALRHHRVLAFYGVCDIGEGVGLVAPYMNNGNMALYLKRNPSADKIALLCQVAEGLQYLHEDARIVHGDIKAENVLITNAGNVLLADFGLSASLVPSGTCTGIRQIKTLRFSAFELLNSEGEDLGRKTCATDVYAFGMLVYEVMTGAPPWPKLNDIAVMREIMQGCVPPRPKEIDDDLWVLCLRCWSMVPEYRPSISEVLGTLVVIRRAKAQAGIPAITANARTMSLPIRRTTGSLSASGESKRLNPYAAPFRPKRPISLMSPVTATFSPPSRTPSFSSSLYEIPTSANSPPPTTPPSGGSSFSSSSSAPSSLYKSSTSSADSASNSNSSPPSTVPTPSSSYAQLELSPTKFAFNVYAKPFYPRTTTHM